MKIYSVVFFVLIMPFCVFGRNEPITWSVPDSPWPEKYGNHRAVVHIHEKSDAVRLTFLWRRHDKDPANKRMLLVHSATNDTIPNIFRLEINNASCDLVFGPAQKGKYYFYYLSYKVQEGWGFYQGDYIKPEASPPTDWIMENKLNNKEHVSQLPRADILAIQSRTQFDSFYPMEVIPTRQEKENFLKKNDVDYLLFPEDRKYPIRMKDDIPLKWITKTEADTFNGTALKNEYYTFQIGVFAKDKDLNNLRILFSDLQSARRDFIPVGSLTCFNTGGIDPDGKPFEKTVNVTKNQVRALWIGVDIPETIKAGTYYGTITVSPQNAEPQSVKVKLTIPNKLLSDRGDGELWRHSRLRWLNSKRGLSDESVHPYPAIELEDNRIKISDFSLDLGQDGLVESIIRNDQAILSQAIRFTVISDSGEVPFKGQKWKIVDQKSGKLTLSVMQSSPRLDMNAIITFESDGYIHYRFNIKAKQSISIQDIRLDIPFNPDIAEYMMGMGRPGSMVPERHQAGWEGPHDSFWVGNTYVGLYCELRGASYSGPLLNLYHPDPPASWYNQGNGGFIIEKHRDETIASVFSGARDLKIGDKQEFEFSLLLTPVKSLDTKSQFTDRYYHNGLEPIPADNDFDSGIKIINIHHANPYNPYINYPFIAQKQLRDIVKKMHQKGVKVKIYYTLREFTNYMTELWALRSLDYEIFSDGQGGGYPWLREHLVDSYTPQWYQHYKNQPADAAIKTSSGDSRLYNYYIEGLNWLVKNMDIDGLYMDDVAFDRRILKRMRRVMESVKPGCLIDLHSNTGFSKGPATQYTEFFPYINKLWFGESFQYDNMSPANWLVEVSGIPFGLMGDMLHAGGNPWRGMVYGMTVRYPWFTEGVQCDPRDIWKVWDSFGIADARMVGYWDKKPVVSTSHADILATAFLKKDKMLVAVASWADDTSSVNLNIDWNRVGLDPENVIVSLSDIKEFQKSGSIRLDDSLVVEPKKGVLLLFEAPVIE